MKSKTHYKPFENAEVAAVFMALPEQVSPKLLALRELIFETAAATEGVGELQEALRWGEPSYLTTRSKTGSMIRLNKHPAGGDRFAMYFHCQTNLVATFRELYPRTFTFEGDRALTFTADDKLPVDELRHCIELALTYHRDKKVAAKRPRRTAKARQA